MFLRIREMQKLRQEPRHDGALTVHHDETFASLRVVTIAEGLDMVSLTQILVWDLPVDAKVRNKVARHARDTLLGTVSLIEKSAGAKRNSKKVGDVLLREIVRREEVRRREHFLPPQRTNPGPDSNL